jgi:flagellar protein FliJ
MTRSEARIRVQDAAAAGRRSDKGSVSGSGSFRFRLERVRALREHGEDVAKQALAGALMRREECEEKLHDAEKQLDEARTAQRDTGTSQTAIDLVARQAYLERVEQTRDATARDLDLHEAEVATRRDLLTEAARAREALERLKERRRADHELELARRSGRELDEVALNVYRRGAGGAT